MSRSGYCDDYDVDNWRQIMWRGAVLSAIRGKRGQAFLREMLAALDALPEKKLIANELMDESGMVCALGAVGKARGLDMKSLDPEDYDTVAATFDISNALAQEIMWENDEYRSTAEDRFDRMRKLVIYYLKDYPAPSGRLVGLGKTEI